MLERPSNELETAMSALENAISMLGTVTTTTNDPHVSRREYEPAVAARRQQQASARVSMDLAELH